MNFFKKLFGKKETESKPLVEVKKQSSYSIETNSNSPSLINIDTTDNQVEVAQSNYNISDIKKRCTQIKKTDGILAAINYMKSFIKSHDITFKELISLLKKVVPYMKKEKTIEDTEIINYINAQIDKYGEKDELEYHADIAIIFKHIESRVAIDYLEKKIAVIKSSKNNLNEHFDILIKLADYYIDEKLGDSAFQTIRKAGILAVNYNDKFDFLFKQRILAERSALICLNGQKKPNYDDYLHYTIVAFILEISIDLCGFPYLSSFFYRKNACFNQGWYFIDNPYFDRALKDLNILAHKSNLVNDIYEFVFNVLPIKIGIIDKYLDESLYNKPTSEFHDTINIFSEEVERVKLSPFDINIAHDFAGHIVKHYYDLENTVK